MALAYLSAEAARAKLIALEVYTETTAPTTAKLELVLEGLEAVLNEWFGGCIAPTTYTELIYTDTSPYGLTTHYPVLAILNVQAPPNTQMPVFVTPQRALTGQMRTVFLGGSGLNYIVTYQAGYNPLPAGLTNTLLSILKKSLASSDPLSTAWLTTPAKEVKSLNLPGGLSKTYEFAKGGGGGSGLATPAPTELDKLLAPFARFKRRLITVGGM